MYAGIQRFRRSGVTFQCMPTDEELSMTDAVLKVQRESEAKQAKSADPPEDVDRAPETEVTEEPEIEDS